MEVIIVTLFIIVFVVFVFALQGNLDDISTMFIYFIVGCLFLLLCVVCNSIENQEQEITVNKIQDVDTQNINIYINGTKVTAQEESVGLQDGSYNISINGITINPHNINLNDCDFSVDTELRKITISEKNSDSGVKDMEPYEIHINGSDINIKNLNLNDFIITVDEGNRWIVLTKK